MKSKLLYLVLPCLLVFCIVLSCALPASAAYITGDVEPEGVVYLTDQTPETEVMPDRIRYTYSFEQPDDNYYWSSFQSISSSAFKSYDLGTSFVTLSTSVSSSSSQRDNYLEIYPVGRHFYRLPCDASIIADTELLWIFSCQCRVQTVTYADGVTTYSYSKGKSGTAQFYIMFYDEDFNLLSEDLSSASGSSSGTASEDTFGDMKFTGSISIPDDAVYFVPRVRVYDKDYVKGSSTSYTYTQDQYSSTGMSFSVRFDVMTDGGSVDGVWKANNAIVGPFEVDQTVFFTCDGVSYSGMDFDISGSVKSLSYLLSDSRETVYVDQWYGDSKKTIDFGAQMQYVNSAWYAWFIDNFTRIGDSAVDTPGGSISIYDYGSGSLIQKIDTSLACLIQATDTGIAVQQYSTGTTLYSYTWEGEDAFAGFSLGSLGHVQYEVGSYYISMGGSAYKIYLYGEDDLTSDDNGGSSGGDNSGSSGEDLVLKAGQWECNSSVMTGDYLNLTTWPADLSSVDLDFVSSGVSFSEMSYSYDIEVSNSYCIYYGDRRVYTYGNTDTGFTQSAYALIYLPSVQTVSQEFYDWFTDNFNYLGSTQIVSSYSTVVNVYNYNGTILHTSYSLSDQFAAPYVSGEILENGLQLTDPSGNVWSWTEAGDPFYGFALNPNSSILAYEPGEVIEGGGAAADFVLNLYLVDTLVTNDSEYQSGVLGWLSSLFDKLNDGLQGVIDALAPSEGASFLGIIDFSAIGDFFSDAYADIFSVFGLRDLINDPGSSFAWLLG